MVFLSGKMIPLELKSLAKEAGEESCPETSNPNYDRMVEQWDDDLTEKLTNLLEDCDVEYELTDDESEELNDVARAYMEGGEVIDEYFLEGSTAEMKTKHLAKLQDRQKKVKRINDICDEILEKVVDPLVTMLGKGLKSRVEEIKQLVGEL